MAKANDILLLCTTDVPEGYKVKKVLGMAWGTEMRSVGLFENLGAFFHGRRGKTSPELKMIMDARRGCVDRMIEAAKKMGANGIVRVQLTGLSFRLNSVEFTAYGTAVIVEKKGK